MATVLHGCQTYDFEPVQPLALAQTTQSKNVVARQLKPNLMLLVDKSGSMSDQVTPTTTRMDELQLAMGQFLGNSGTIARMGLAFFPAGSTCEPTNSVEVNLPPPANVDDTTQDGINQANANQVNTRVQAASPLGGTPTGQSLRYIGGLPGLTDHNDQRQDFILLLTDGLPNCNPQNVNDCTNLGACDCTLSTCGTSTSAQYCRLGCLDRGGVVQDIQDLRAKSIKTIVVGFGAGTAMGTAPDTLNAMAEAGGFARACPMGTDAECGSSNTCLAGNVCEKKFYQAANATELAQALANISDILKGIDLCEFTLESVPSDPRFLAVIVDGVNQAPSPDTWKYDAGKVIFQGAMCNQIKAATPANPVKVEIRIVERF